LQLTVDEAAKGLESGAFTTVQLTKAYMARIDEVSSFRAVLHVNPDALLAAQQLYEERAESGPRRYVESAVAVSFSPH
jgi:amidase